MSYSTLRPGRPVAVAALSLLLLLAVAVPLARADGEDDPTFGNVGTGFVSLSGFAPLMDPETGGAMRPRTDQAPDGALISAIPLHADPLNRSNPDLVRVVRMDASGKPVGLDGDGIVDLNYGSIFRLLDVEALGGGRILLVTESFSSAGRGSASLEIRTLDAAGNEIGDGVEFQPPEDCGNNNAEPVSGDVSADGVVYVGWDECEYENDRGKDADAVLARYDGEDELARVMPVEFVTEVLLGADNRVYVLSFDPGIFNGQGRGINGGSLVTRYDPTDLDLDGDYGDEGIAQVDGTPIDMTVSPNGRAVVWTEPVSFGTRGDEQETWDFYGLDGGGEPDDSWSGDGHADITHPELGSERSGQCTRGRFCGAEVPQVIAQGDNKIIAVGYPPPDEEQTNEVFLRGGEPPREETDRTIIRLGTGGALDPSWDGDGVRPFALTQPPDGSGEYLTLGPPALQADGKLLIPLFTESGRQDTRVPAPPDGVAYGLSRIGLTPAGAPVVAQQQAASSVAAVAAKRSCVSRRVFRIRLRTGRRKAERSAIKTVAVTVNGKSVAVTKGARRRAQVDLRNLPKGRFTVVIRMTLADGGKVRDTRRYRTCTPKQARELPGLRTRKPRKK